MTREDVKRLWAEARKDIMVECGLDTQKFALAEILGLRQVAQDILERQILTRVTKPKPQKHKTFVR